MREEFNFDFTDETGRDIIKETVAEMERLENLPSVPAIPKGFRKEIKENEHSGQEREGRS